MSRVSSLRIRPENRPVIPDRPERLLTVDDVAARLRVEKKTILRHMPLLKARGLQEIRLGRRLVRYRESSLDRMIRRAAEREEPLF